MRILGIDYGSKRIGLAISDIGGSMAQPLKTIERRNDRETIREIEKVVGEYSVEKLVVGLPVSMSGEPGKQAQEVLAFIEMLRDNIPLQIETWDERLTTSIAERALLESNMKRSRRKGVIDKVAAAVLLQGYLDSKRMGEK